MKKVFLQATNQFLSREVLHRNKEGRFDGSYGGAVRQVVKIQSSNTVIYVLYGCFLNAYREQHLKNSKNVEN